MCFKILELGHGRARRHLGEGDEDPIRALRVFGLQLAAIANRTWQVQECNFQPQLVAKTICHKCDFGCEAAVSVDVAGKLFLA